MKTLTLRALYSHAQDHAGGDSARNHSMAWSLMQCQTLIVTVSTLACQQHDASATIKKEDTFSCCISARDMTPSIIMITSFLFSWIHLTQGFLSWGPWWTMRKGILSFHHSALLFNYTSVDKAHSTSPTLQQFKHPEWIQQLLTGFFFSLETQVGIN